MGNRGTRRILAVSLLATLCGCHTGPRMAYVSLLTPEESEREGYSLGDDGVVSCFLDGSRIDVQFLSDGELNGMFPDASTGGRLVTNPYTYGDWVDPSLGYVPNRFTVFRVTVANYTHPQMLLDPSRVTLLTDRGELLESYTVEPRAGRKSLEGYYRALRGISGNEHYRFAIRLGVVRGTVYDEEQMVFKGESYGGLVVFDPLHADVHGVRLVLKDVAYAFDAKGRPIAAADLSFDFDREVTIAQLQADSVEASSAGMARVVVTGPRQIVGAEQGDLARDIGAINTIVNRNLGDLNACYRTAFEAGAAVEGVVAVQFTIRTSGVVEGVEVVESGIGSPEVAACVAKEVSRWLFEPAGKFAEPADLPHQPERRAGPALSDVVVVYPFTFKGPEGNRDGSAEGM